MAAKEEARPLSFERAEGQTRGGRDESLMPEKPPRRNSLARRPCFLLARMHESSPFRAGNWLLIAINGLTLPAILDLNRLLSTRNAYASYALFR